MKKVETVKVTNCKCGHTFVAPAHAFKCPYCMSDTPEGEKKSDTLGNRAKAFFAGRQWIGIAILIQVAYLVLGSYSTCSLCLADVAGTMWQFPGDRWPTIRYFCADWAIFYETSRVYFSAAKWHLSPSVVYDAALMADWFAVLPFRYLPSFLYLMYPLTLLPMIPAFLIFNSISLACNIGQIFLLQSLFKKIKADSVISNVSIFCYIVYPGFSSNFYQGQMISFITLTILAALNFLAGKRYFLAGLLLGISISLKPVAQFFLPPLLIYFLKKESGVKDGVKALIGLVLPILPNALIFMSVPGLLEGFLTINKDGMAYAGFRPAISGAVGIISLISHLWQLESAYYISLSLIIISVAINCLCILRMKSDQNRLLSVFVSGILSYFCYQPDIWDSQVPFVFLGIIILFNLVISDNTISHSSKRNLFAVIGYLAAFVAGITLMLVSMTLDDFWRYSDWIFLLYVAYIIATLPFFYIWWFSERLFLRRVPISDK